MDYAEARDEARRRETNYELHDFSWEEEHIPLLHSGFLQCQEGNNNKSRLSLSIWFGKGSYRALLSDRTSGERAFVEFGTLGQAFQILEKGLREDRLDWSRVEDQ